MKVDRGVQNKTFDFSVGFRRKRVDSTPKAQLRLDPQTKGQPVGPMTKNGSPRKKQTVRSVQVRKGKSSRIQSSPHHHRCSTRSGDPQTWVPTWRNSSDVPSESWQRLRFGVETGHCWGCRLSQEKGCDSCQNPLAMAQTPPVSAGSKLLHGCPTK